MSKFVELPGIRQDLLCRMKQVEACTVPPITRNQGLQPARKNPTSLMFIIFPLMRHHLD